MESYYCFTCREDGTFECRECGGPSCNRCDHDLRHCLRRLKARLEQVEGYVERLKEVAQG